MAFKMRGNPMQRNFGVGSPMNSNGEDEKKKKSKNWKDVLGKFAANVVGGPVGNLIYEKAKDYDEKNPSKRKGHNQPPSRKI